MTYYEKLKDPRWQKKRLEILNRDEFTCKICNDTKSTLHIHHKYYEYGNDPWDYPDNCFITLCADCHESEEMNIKEYSKLFIDTLKKSNFVADDWREIAYGINTIKYGINPSKLASIISKIFTDSDIQILLFKHYYNK